MLDKDLVHFCWEFCFFGMNKLLLQKSVLMHLIEKQ